MMGSMRIFAFALLLAAAPGLATPAFPQGSASPPLRPESPAAAPEKPETDAAAPQKQADKPDADKQAKPAEVTLDDLFAKLKAARTAGIARRYASEIEARWLRSGSDTVDLLMARASEAIAARNAPLALDLLDSVIMLKPDYAEAWNRRAVVYFTRRNFDHAIEDVDVTLRLEPRHWGAMVGLATILAEFDQKGKALDVYRKALEIYPLLPEVGKKVEDLSEEVQGRKS